MYGFEPKQVMSGNEANNYGGTAYVTANASAANCFASPSFREPATVQRFGFKVTTAFAQDSDGQAMVLTLYRLPLNVADANRIALGTITVPIGANYAANTVVYADISDAFVAATKVAGAITVRARNKADLNAGDGVQMAVTTNMTGTNKVGVFDPFIVYSFRPEPTGNMAHVVNLTP